MPRVLIALLFTALAIRLGWVLSRDSRDEVALASLPDQREYLELGRNLLHGRGLVMRDDRLDVNVYAFRAPGYPMFVALCGGNIRAVRIAQALLDTSTVLALYLLARKFLQPGASLFASAFVAFNPYLVHLSALMLSETLFIALIAWGMYRLTTRTWWAGAIILALSIIVRPGAMLLPIALALGSAWLRKSNHRELIVRPLVAATLIALILFPWAYRNHRVIDRWVWTSSNGGITMYDGLNPAATGASDQRFVPSKLTELQALPNEVDRSEHFTHQALEFIKGNPGRAIGLTLRKIGRTWSPIPLSPEYGGNMLLRLVAAVYTLPLFALAIVGLWSGSTLRAPAKVFLLLPAIYFTAIHAVSVGSLRYRLPADVPMSLVAASALVRQRVQSLEFRVQKTPDSTSPSSDL